MHIHVLNRMQLALGVNPLQPSHVIHLGQEQIAPYNPAELTKSLDQPTISSRAESQQPSLNGSRLTRRSGDYWFEIKGRRFECRSLKELLSKGLLALEKNRPGTLDKLFHIKPRSRRIVARDPKDLFDQKHLVKNYSEKLTDGWWFGTNNSARETTAWLERACSCSGLKWNDDFKISLILPTALTLEDLDL